MAVHYPHPMVTTVYALEGLGYSDLNQRVQIGSLVGAVCPCLAGLAALCGS